MLDTKFAEASKDAREDGGEERMKRAMERAMLGVPLVSITTAQSNRNE